MGQIEIWMIRHGETDWSQAGRHTGRSDVRLTAHGREQALRLAPLLSKQVFDRVWCSPLSRAQDTAHQAGFNDRFDLMTDLLEWDYGVYEGLTTDEIRISQPAFSTWTAEIEGGETLQQVGIRAKRVIDRAATEKGRTLLFAHAHLLRILTAKWLGLEPDAGRLLALDPASVSILGHEHETRVIRLWNLTQTWCD